MIWIQLVPYGEQISVGSFYTHAYNASNGFIVRQNLNILIPVVWLIKSLQVDLHTTMISKVTKWTTSFMPALSGTLSFFMEH